MAVSLQNTSISEGFGVFKKIAQEKIDFGENNFLNLYILDNENKLFNYDQLYEYILNNLCQYVFDRRRNSEAQKDSIKSRKLILEAINHLRKVTSDKDSGAGGELGEILLYVFLEQDLQAPKLFSKVELKTSTQDYVKGCDAIHFKFRTNVDGKKILQLIIGEAKIKNNLNDGIKEAFVSINKYLSNNTQDYRLLDTHLMNQLVDEDEAREIRDYILSIPRKKKETIFGIFIGYSINYDGANDKRDEYDTKIIEENKKQVLSYKQNIINQINKYNISNYEFNFYFLPFHDAMRDRKTIIEQLTCGKDRFSYGDIKNG